MIKKFKFTSLLFILICLIITGCQAPSGDNPPDVKEDVIEIKANEEVVTIKDSLVEDYDFTKLFYIYVNGNRVAVKESYIDHSTVTTTPGTYYVSCMYKEEIEVVEVRVIPTVYTLVLLQPSVVIKLAELEDYNFKALFTAKIDDEAVEITDSMISHNIETKAGEYTYSVTFNGIVKTLNVTIEDKDITEVITAYQNIDLTISEIRDFDFTTLFGVYVNYKQVEVKEHMIDKSAISNPKVGNSYEVSITYQYKTATIIINVVEEDEIQLSSKNIFTYPSSEYIDLTTLFSIKKGEQEIPVTLDMISGSIDYSKIGINEITLTYEGQTVTATVEVKRGVIIDYASSDTVVIVKGTNQESYPFLNDFEVYINGILFNNISDEYLDTSNVDFNTTGTYEAKLTIPYNDNKLGLTSVNFTYYEKTITYVVVNNEYNIKILKDLVTLPIGTTSYKVYSNLNVTINGRNQALTENKNYVDVITCYVETLSDPIDFNHVGLQEVKIAVYANGVDYDPIIVTYNVIIESNIKITSNNKVIFTGDDLYPTDLFTIYEGNKKVAVTLDMINGNFNSYKSGVYTLTINYKDIIQTATVIVFDSNMKGTYKTDLDNINTYNYDDDTEITKVTDLVIGNDGSIMFNGSSATIISAMDEGTMILKYLSYEYTLYYEDGIILLMPDNAIKLGYSRDKRPFIYFNEELWTIEDKVIINYSSEHVLNNSFTTYSIDAFKIKNNNINESMWYGLKVYLIEKTNADTVYHDTYGEVIFNENFEMVVDKESSLIFNEEKYEFKMISEKVGQVSKATQNKEYANLTFTGTVDGQPAELRADTYEGYSFYIKSEQIFHVGSYDVSNMTNGGSNYEDKEVLLYEFNDDLFSYKFKVNPTDLTFTLVERDLYFGLYETDGMYLFLDGYGTGVVNFNTKSFYKYPFEYTVYGETIKLEFINTSPIFEYGKGMDLYMSPLLNVIKVIDADYEVVVGTEFVNSNITEGAIIRINSYRVGQDSDAVAKVNFLNNIEIITKDGVLNNTQKEAIIDLSRIKFSTPGFYQFTITININGENKVVYYGMEVLKIIYEGNPVVGAYGTGVLNQQNSLTIDKYGQAIVNCNGNIYRGTVHILDDYSFSINANDLDGHKITISGTYIAEGLIQIRCNGDYSFSDYFTTGKVNIIGTKGFVLRQFVLKNQNVYILSNAETARGEIASLEVLEGNNPMQIGAVIKVTEDTNSYIIKVVSWGNTSSGVVISDEYRGSYTSNNSTITIDGFGNASVDGVTGVYVLNGAVATITSSNETKVYRLNKEEGSFEIVEIALDNSLVSGKSFTANHMFSCGYSVYYADTTFTFGENGVVTVVSTSSHHDSGDDACTDDVYSPTFASSTGVKGTYSVKGNKLTVVVAGEEIIFLINNVLKADELTCESTSISNEAHGHFKVGTIFVKK